jgi:predicted methyltransferase
MSRWAGTLFATLLAVFTCNAFGTADPDTGAVDAVRAVMNSPDRLAGDADADARRKPDQVLAFFGIRPGMVVLEMFAGGGYYTELLSGLVGNDGAVVAQNNAPYLQYTADEQALRFAPGRLPNVERLTAENNELSLDEGRFDAAIFTLAYHDVYWVNEDIGWPAIDAPAMLAEIFASLKPGAVVGVVDHVAAAGSGPESVQALHRIDPELLKADFEAAGFVFEAESDVLRNPADDHTLPMSAKEIRGKTDRFVYRFRRP